MEVISNNKIHDFFDHLEAQNSLLAKCSDLYETLTSHFTSLHNSINSKTLNLDSKLQSLDLTHQKSLTDLDRRENSIPNRLVSLTSEIDSKRQSGIHECQKKLDTTAEPSDVLKSLCRRMDYWGLMKYLGGKRKSLRDEMKEAFKECVDPARMVLETVKDFVEAKLASEKMADKRRGCGVVVSGLFPAEELKNRRKGYVFARKTVAEAEALVRHWRARVDEAEVNVSDGNRNGNDAAGNRNGNDGDGGDSDGNCNGNGCGGNRVGDGGDGGDGDRNRNGNDGDGDGDGDDGNRNGNSVESKMGSAEVVMFLQVVLGFGLKEIFEVEFYKWLLLEFTAARTDQAQLAIVVLGDLLPDFIDQLVKNGKEIEAIYFASESGLTDRFQPVALLQSYLNSSKNKTTEILKNGNHDAGAIEESKNFEIRYLKSIIKCVEDLKLEADFSVDSLKRRLLLLLKEKAEKKKGPESFKPPYKRPYDSRASRRSGGMPSRPVKRPKHPSYRRPEVVSRAVGQPSRYVGTYSLSGQSVYERGITASTQGQRYGASLVPSADQITQQHYGGPSASASTPGAGHWPSSYAVPSGSVPSQSAGPPPSYGLQNAYNVYDYGATTTSTYQPPPYAP